LLTSAYLVIRCVTVLACHIRAGGEPQSSDSEGTTTKNGKHNIQKRVSRVNLLYDFSNRTL